MTSKALNLNRWLRWAAVITTSLYLAMFFAKLLNRYLQWKVTGMDIDWSVPTNPQSMIALCLVTATMSLCFLHGRGKLLAFLLFGVVIGFFYYWATLTTQIKINMGITAIPGAGAIGNVWIGAGWLDLTVLILALGLLSFDLYLVWKERGELFSRHRNLHPSNS
jgi:lipoprotein signal peptidase